MEERKVVNPSAKWAQRKDKLYITLDSRDLSETNREIILTPEGKLTLKGQNKAGTIDYLREIELANNVIVEESSWKVTDLCVQFSIAKADQEAEFWPRLTKEKAKYAWLTIDWSKWVDESDEEEAEQPDFGDMERFPSYRTIRLDDIHKELLWEVLSYAPSNLFLLEAVNNNFSTVIKSDTTYFKGLLSAVYSKTGIEESTFSDCKNMLKAELAS